LLDCACNRKHELLYPNILIPKSILPIFDITTRIAIPDDLDDLRDLAIQTFTAAYARFNTSENMRKYISENFSEAKLNEELNSEKVEILLGESKSEIVAYVKLVKSPERKTEASNPVEIARLYTRINLIGQGIGKSMLEAVEYYARENGHDAICLDVWQKNFQAVNFYQREGFRICGTTQFVLGTDAQDDFVMIRTIEPLKD